MTSGHPDVPDRSTAFRNWQGPLVFAYPRPLMTRLLRILLVAVLLGPQVGTLFVPHEAACQEAADCCTPDGGCDVSCVTCACCATRPSSFPTSVTVAPVHASTRTAAPVAGAVSLPLRSTDILHVPKSV